jgi:membrane fusion protein, adhesin transport system
MSNFVNKIKNLPLESITLLWIVIIFSTFLCWSLLAQVDQVVRGRGVVVSAEKAHDVESNTSAKITKINVGLGDVVQKNDVLVTLDSTAIDLQLEQNYNSLLQAEAELSRLKAELNDAEIKFSSSINDNIRLLQTNIWRANLAARKFKDLSAKSTLYSYVEQRNNLEQKLALKLESAELLNTKIESVSTLAGQGVVPKMTLLDLKRERISLEENILAYRSKSEDLLAAIQTARYEINEYNEAIKANIASDRLTAQERVQYLTTEISIGENKLSDTKLIAPMNGIVSNIDIHTSGTVIAPGERILEVTPISNQFKIEVKIEPKDAARMRIGSKARIKLSAYNYSQYGHLEGTVITMGGNTVSEESNTPYFRILMQIDSNKFSKESNTVATIIPGMNGTVEILGDKKTIFEYLTYPFSQVKESAFTR